MREFSHWLPLLLSWIKSFVLRKRFNQNKTEVISAPPFSRQVAYSVTGHTGIPFQYLKLMTVRTAGRGLRNGVAVRGFVNGRGPAGSRHRISFHENVSSRTKCIGSRTLFRKNVLTGTNCTIAKRFKRYLPNVSNLWLKSEYVRKNLPFSGQNVLGFAI